ncbi:hypothetical protein [Zooshikella sp. RANM57]|uniref:hypothetical protein n=1 Tax=Zooshikella sp. RANM57 TaxID=3425863 RepID=UPI003D6FA6E8
MIKNLVKISVFVSVFSVTSTYGATPGTYQYFYDWGCDGSYAQTTITYNSNGTFTDGQSNSGNWSERNQIVIHGYQNGVLYTGYHSGNVIVGVSGTTSNLSGCYYLVKTSNGFATELKSLDQSEKRDAAGLEIFE